MKPNTTTDTTKHSHTQNDASSDTMHKEHLYGLGITDDDKNDKANVKAACETQASSVQKRLLSDMDTATIVAAGKVGANETNKCSDGSAGRDSSGLNALSQMCGGGGGISGTDRSVEKRSGASPITSPTSPSSIVSVSTAASSSTNAATSTTALYSHSNERRPSWRLKLDSGCKVCNLEPKHKAFQRMCLHLYSVYNYDSI